MEDCVITCPPNWGDHERRLLIDAARIVGLNVVRLMNTTTALAAAYGLLRPLPKNPRHIMFVDVGLAATDVCIAKLVEGEVRILATASEPNVGARDFDRLLFEHLVKAIQEQFKVDISGDEKARVKLMREASRIKSVLSANTSAKYNLECFVDGKDISGVVSRAEFESLGANLLKSLQTPVYEALDEAKLSMTDLSSVEVVGGYSCIHPNDAIMNTISDICTSVPLRPRNFLSPLAQTFYVTPGPHEFLAFKDRLQRLLVCR